MNIALFGVSTIPIVDKKFIYNLEDPEQSKRMFKFDGGKYLLDDENKLLSKGMVVECIQVRDYCGMPESILV